MKPLLDKNAIRHLEDNGYKFIQKDQLITFKKSFDYVSIIVVSFLTLLIASILLIFNTLLGVLTILIGIIGIIVHRRYFAKRMNFVVNLKTQKFDFFDNVIELEKQSLSYASKIMLHSQFVDEYTSSFKTTSEEHRITIKIQLLSGSIFTLFEFHSDYQKPSDEVMEIHKLIKKLIHWSKKKVAESEA